MSAGSPLHPLVRGLSDVLCRAAAVTMVGAVLVLTACDDEASDQASSGSSNGQYKIAYRAGSQALLDIRVDASFSVSAPAGKTLLALPNLDGAKLAEARTIVDGSNEQRTTLKLSTGATQEDGARLYLDFTLSRAFGSEQARKLDAGETVPVTCALFFVDGEDKTSPGGGDCTVRRSEGGFAVTFASTTVGHDDKAASLNGTIVFSPVPHVPYATSASGGCPTGSVCLSLDPKSYDPATGYCLPEVNSRSGAPPCDAVCTSPLRIKTGGQETCICASVCGNVAGGSSDLPVCDPAYGCIDI